MDDRLLLDTDVLIDYLRNRPEAVKYLESQTGALLVSVGTVAELYSGVREGQERSRLDEFLQGLEVAPIDLPIAVRGGLYHRDYGKSHGTGFVDALIAATAERQQATLVTLNRKHYPMVADLLVPYRKG